MSEFFVSLSSIEDVRQFVNAATCCPCEVDVLSGRYVIDAKSIMGLFSLDLSHPVKVEVHGSDADRAAFEQRVAAVEVKQPQEYKIRRAALGRPPFSTVYKPAASVVE